ncbi:MAG: YIP1 family protein [candidate division Zixibacteria bacterium]|nr:YIP1 family protein [candidate division Zixibacteria bacterium]
MENNIQTSQTSEHIEKPGIIARLMMVFSEPSKLFGTLTGKTDWLIPLIIVGILGGAIYYQTRPIYTEGMESTVMEMLENYKERMPEAQYEQMLEDAKKQFDEGRENKFEWYLPLVWFGLPLVIWLIISSLGLMSGNFIFGGKANFWIIMNVVAWAALIGFLGDFVRGIMIVLKDSMYVYTGLGLITPANDGSFMYYLFRQVDIFSIWRIIVTGIGLGVIYKMKPKKFVIVLLIVWIIFISLVAGANMFTGGTIIY